MMRRHLFSMYNIGSWSFGFESLFLGIMFLSFWSVGKCIFLLGPCLSYFVGVVIAYGSLDNFGWFFVYVGGCFRAFWRGL